jgi:hypothetical protein
VITKTTKQHSPLKQFFSGINSQDIKCKEVLSLVFKNSNSHPACVKPSNIQKLIERGWANDNTTEHMMEIKN